MWGERNEAWPATGAVVLVAEIDSGRGKAGYVCALRGDACALARSVDDIYIYTNKIGIDFASKGSLQLAPLIVQGSNWLAIGLHTRSHLFLVEIEQFICTTWGTHTLQIMHI